MCYTFRVIDYKGKHRSRLQMKPKNRGSKKSKCVQEMRENCGFL